MISIDEQIDGNVLIAKFLNWQLDLSFPDKGKVWRSPNGYIELDSTMKFHSDWNQLMIVCDKIINLYFDKREKIFEGLADVNKEKTWKAVVEFIEFWNDDTKEKLTWNNTNI